MEDKAKNTEDKNYEIIEPNIPENFVGGHGNGPEWNALDPNKPLDEATKESQRELTAEEQQAILQQIVRDSKQRSAMSLFKKPVNQKSVNADKKRKAKIKAAKKARKRNRK